VSRALVRLAALSGAVAVIAGAFGAHGASGKAAEWLRTGGEYEMVHALAAILAAQLRAKLAGWILLAGSVLFAATLYLMALGWPHWLGAVTPVGGMGMIIGWLLLAWQAAPANRKR
jgi:uncharacterized membrane protein YgdD (TMEM256/DUF423 family)